MIYTTLGLIVLGFFLLIKGADWLVDGASEVARTYRISELVIGLTVVAFGTSAPELVVNSVAAMDAQSDIVLGNIIGSNNFNLFIILGLVGMIFPITVQSGTVWKEIPISVFAVLVFFVLAKFFPDGYDLSLGGMEAALMLFFFATFLYSVFIQVRADQSNEVHIEESSPASRSWLKILLGLTALIIGGKLVVESSVDLATSFGVSTKIIGLTIVAAGTSLPELATSLVAAFKKNSDMAIGNVIGSNIFNLWLILPISALINDVAYREAFDIDVYALIGGSVFLFIAMFTGGKRKLDRWEAFVLFASYLAYILYLIGQEL